MTYVHITRRPGASMAEYERVGRELAPGAMAGQLGHHVGVVDGSLVIVDVWESRAAADRFAAEHLFPAFERAGVRTGADIDVTAFEALHSVGAA